MTIPKDGKITVTATSLTPGPITALPGQINIIVTPTAGWISITNHSAAKPGQPIEVRCRQKLLQRTTEPLYAYEGDYLANVGCQNCIPRLVRVYSDAKTDAYIDEPSLEEAIRFRISHTFTGHFYFVYRDESARQEAIAEIRRHRGNHQSGDKLQELKYVFLDLGYSKNGMFGVVTPDGLPLPGPVISISSILYLSPLGCEVSDYFLKLNNSPGYPDPEAEIIRTSRRGIDVDTPGWNIFLGDVARLRTKIGFAALKTGPDLTPLLYQVLLNVTKKIDEGISKAADSTKK